MPYSIRKGPCTQSSGKKGNYTVSYTDKHGKKHKSCHTSSKKAKGQVAAIEMNKESQDDAGDMIEECLIDFIGTVLGVI